jgi:hypothetical protein
LPPQARPEVTVALERTPRIAGVRLHRSGLLVERDVTEIDRIPATATRLGRAPGRSPRKLQPLIDARIASGGDRESHVEDFVYEAIRRFALPLPLCQHWIDVNGRRYRLDMAYDDAKVAIEVDGFDPHRGRNSFDGDRARGNDITLAGYTLLRFTSASTDWRIATTIAEALRMPRPTRPDHELTFAAWSRVCADRAL